MSRYNTVTKGKGYNVQTGSYGNLSNNQLKNIALPDKLRCKRCQKWKQADGMENFSKKQLAALQCSVCNNYKGLEEFAFAQRRDPDAAKCLDCMNEQLDFDSDVVLDQLHNLRRPDGAIKGSAEDYSSDDSEDGMSYDYTSDGDDNTTNVADSSTYDDDTSESACEGSAATGSRHLSASMNTLNISTNASASSGGVQLAQRDTQLSTWQRVPSGRARKPASSSTAASGSISSSSINAQYNRTGFAKIKAYKPPTEPYTTPFKQQKNAGSSKMPARSQTASKCTKSDWDSEEEENGSIATTRATRATQTDLDNLEEDEITWDSDSDESDADESDSDE
ncbi:hypothetical protein FKW77_009146 [Venturia effusa]|uniref:Stc1 domain-containing protein n=1 Tax=Venturia effusa TaxID=50376 RepID=A0A517LEH6_9PEZI|nr:hypothetical protein FKW77_009146 [Venturia effusa]